MGGIYTKISNKILLAAIILFVGIGVRVWGFGHVPESLYWDEIAMLLDARSVAQTGMDIHGRPWLQPIFPSYGDYKLPVYIVVTSGFVKIFGTAEWVVRVPSLLAGVGSIVGIGVLAYEFSKSLRIFKKEKNKQEHLERFRHHAALASMVVVACSPWSILFSRTGFEGHLAQFLVILSVIALLKVRPKVVGVLVASVFGAIATYTYFSVRFVWPVVFIGVELWFVGSEVWMQYFAQREKPSKEVLFNSVKKTVQSFIFIAIGLGVFSVCLRPMVKSELYDISNFYRLSTPSVLNSFDYAVQSNQYREIAGNTFLDRVLFHRQWLLLRQLLTNVSANTSLDYLFISGDQNLRHGTGHHGLFLLPFAVPFLVGVCAVWSVNPFMAMLLLAWWGVGILPASVPINVPHALRSLNALAPLSILMGIGVATLLEFVENWKSTRAKNTLYISAMMLFMFFFLQFLLYYFVVYPKTSVKSWQGGFRELAQAVMTQRSAVETILIEPFDQRFYLWLFYLGYTSQQIQEFPTRGFQHHDFDRYLSDPVDWRTVSQVKKRTVIVGEEDFISQKIAEYKLTPVQSDRVTTSGGNYLMVVFSPYQ